MQIETHAKTLALVGVGYWGKNLARNFYALGALHTICDTDAPTLDTYGADFSGVRKTTRFEDVLEDSAITKIAIAAPAVLHYQLARAALQSGKDVFVEKPLCLDENEAQELVELSGQRRLVLMVGHLLQYHPCVVKLQALLAGGELGKLHYITSNRLNLGKIRREENALWSFAPHDFSVILSLAGNQMPEQVRCVGDSYLNQGVADTTLTTLRFGGALRAHVYVSWMNPFKEQKLTVVGSRGLAVFDDTRPWKEKLLLHRDYLTWAKGRVPTPNKTSGEPVIVEETEPLRNECLHFIECCLQRRAPRTDGLEGLRVLRVLRAAQESLEKDGEAVAPEIGRPRSDDKNSQPPTDYFVHSTAFVDEGAIIGAGTKIWHFSHIMKGARIGERCVIGQNVNVDGGTVIGNHVKIQNNVSVYTGLVIEDDVFLGPSCVLTNVTNPRSQVNRQKLYEKTTIKRGATIGANATIVCGITVGRYAFVAAGAVVTKDVPDYALVLGNPARQAGWMSRHGHRLNPQGEDGKMICPEAGLRYRLETVSGSPVSNLQAPPSDVRLRCIDLDEEAPLPTELASGTKMYDQFKA